MAKMYLSPDEEFANSPFGVDLKRRVRRMSKNWARQVNTWLPQGTSENKRTYDLVMAHLFQLCKSSGIRPTLNVGVAGPIIFKQPVPVFRAWDWLISSYERANPDRDEGVKLSIAYARGRLFAMFEAERQRLYKLALSKDTEARQRQYAKERAENGGEVDFWKSGTWQRLRFEVLAESEGCCVLCGRSYREHGVAMEVDHIKPRSRFPDLSLDKGNLQVMCFDCNRGKSNRDTTDWRAANDGEDGDGQEEVA